MCHQKTSMMMLGSTQERNIWLIFIAILTLLSVSSPLAAASDSVAGLERPTKVRRNDLTKVKRVVHETLVVTRGTLWSDGNPLNTTTLINGTSPGPTLRFKPGDLALVKVFNHQPSQNLTIHFHGLSQSLVPFSDGTTMMSQWPVPPGNFFEYELHLVEEDSGSTFYHSHVGLQITTAYGAVIVEDEPCTVPKNAKDRVMTISDYFYLNDSTIEAGLLATPFSWPGSAKSILLNGAAWRATDACNTTVASTQGVDCSQSTYKGPTIIDVDYKTPYRMRWIGAQDLMHLAVGIFNHTQSLITADGTHLQPINVSFVEIMSGQRYDTILHSKSKDQVEMDKSGGCYPIRFETRWRTPVTNGWALLRYPGGNCNTTTPTPLQLNNTQNYLPPAVDFWISNQLHPLKPNGGDGHSVMPSDDQVTRRIILNSWQGPLAPAKNPALRWYVNGDAYHEELPVEGNGKPLDAPYLVQLYKHEALAPSYHRALHPPAGVPEGFDTKTNTYVSKAGEVIDIIIVNNGSITANNTETHPWHFHSQDHWTVAMGYGNFTEENYKAARKNFTDPIPRDTTGVWPGFGASTDMPPDLLPANSSGAWSALRYVVPSDEAGAGVWLLHCHWSFHLYMGMASVWANGPLDGAPTTNSLYADPDYLVYGRNVSAPYTKQHHFP